MPREQWVGFIKDYDGGTLMEYVIHPKIPYADLVGMFKARSVVVLLLCCRCAVLCCAGRAVGGDMLCAVCWEGACC